MTGMRAMKTHVRKRNHKSEIETWLETAKPEDEARVDIRSLSLWSDFLAFGTNQTKFYGNGNPICTIRDCGDREIGA